MTIYYFNPDNDLALASGEAPYTAPPRAEQLRRDLQLLPCWLAGPGNAVLCDDVTQQTWVEAQGLRVTLIDRRQLADLPDDVTFRPWGWSAAMQWRLMHWGVNQTLLPTPGQIRQWRQLSHRQTTIAIHNHVSQVLGTKLCPSPVELTTLEQVTAFATAHTGCYIKAPWSGSGRGILRAIDPHATDFVQRAAGALRRQGSVLCEQAYDRATDFAVEMECAHNRATVRGYSVFESDFHSQYAGGVVAGRDVLRQAITSAFPDFDAVEQAVLQAVTSIVAPHYEGALGVDMLLFRQGGRPLGLNPCVELNLRTTMGHLTVALADRHHLSGRFAIKSAALLRADDIPLTPVAADTVLVAVLTARDEHAHRVLSSW